MCFKLIYALWFILFISQAYQQRTIKIRFHNNSTRPIRDPYEHNYSEMRRSFWEPQNPLCHTLGSSAGALLAYRIKSTSTLTEREILPGHHILNLQTFVKTLTDHLVPRLAMETKCPTALLSGAAEEMCLTIVCSTNDQPMHKKNCLALAMEKNGIFPSNKPKTATQEIEKCTNKHFNLRAPGGNNFSKNPEKYFDFFLNGLQDEILKVYEQLKSAKVSPISLPFPGTTKNQIYVEIAVHGAVLSAHLSKILSETATISRSPRIGSFDMTTFLSYLVKKSVQKLNLKSDEVRNRCHTTALKMTIFWLINNNYFIKNIPAEILAINTLVYVGFGSYYTPNTSLPANFKTKEYAGLFIKFNNPYETLSEASEYIEKQINMNLIKSEIQKLLPHKVLPISNDLLKFEISPLAETPPTILVNNQNGSVGLLPEPDNWFLTELKTEPSSNEFNGVFIATLGVAIGSHVGSVIKDFGLITQKDQPGFKDLISIDIYEIFQELIESFTKRLIKTIPLTLNEGFYVINSAFKTTKFSLCLDRPPNKIPIKTLISLGLKNAEIIDFYPELKTSEIDLMALPSKINVLSLWVQPMLNVNLKQIISKRIKKITKNTFPKVLKDILLMMRTKVPGLSVNNLGSIRSELSQLFPWDSPKLLSFLLDPPSNDGVLGPPRTLIETMKTYLTCPGSIFCQESCAPPSCGNYVCASKNPWCYYPSGIKCPGSLQCPVLLPKLESFVNGSTISSMVKLVTCPENEICQMQNLVCPGNSHCPDEEIVCPGNAKCPLRMKYFQTYMLPCPQHPNCGTNIKALPTEEILFCTSSSLSSCKSHYSKSKNQIVAAIDSATSVLVEAINKQKHNNTASATASVYLDKQLINTASSNATSNESKETANVSTSA